MTSAPKAEPVPDYGIHSEIYRKMSIKKLQQIPEETLKQLCVTSTDAQKVLEKLGLPLHPRSGKFINDFARRNSLEYLSRWTKYEPITKSCPVCSKEFTTKLGHPREKKTCSYSCANSHTKTGPDNGNWKQDCYRTTCFHYHKKKCVVCDEERLVDVHHYDMNHDNNSPENLIPLCPTHHAYMHSRHKSVIEERVRRYQEDWRATCT